MSCTKEQAYDTLIAPLITQVFDACKTHKIAFLATFEIGSAEDQTLCCTSALLYDDCNPSPQLLGAAHILGPYAS